MNTKQTAVLSDSRLSSGRHVDAAALQNRLGMRLVSGLTAKTASLPHDVTERLRFAREKALAQARQVRAAASSVSVVGNSGSAVLAGSAGWSGWAASLMPLVVLLAGLLFISHWSANEQVQLAADIDAQLLADDLPPAAYADPGFAEFLRTSPSRRP
jgi:Protein of unknown function (DUF3619)